MKTFKKSDLIPLILFLAVAAYILYVSYFAGTYLTPDSCSYLRQAKTLLQGNGFNYDAEAGARAHFSTWPIGYPALIAAVSFLTGTGVVLASKILSIIILLLILAIFKRRFGDSSPLISLVVFNLALLRIFTYTLSEQPFLLGLIWFGLAYYDFTVAPRPSFLRAANLLASSLFMFAMRYSGVFAVLFLGLSALRSFIRWIGKKDAHQDSSRFLALLAIIVFQVGVMAAYLFQNYVHSGFLTGMPRIPPPEPFSVLFISLIRAEAIEIGAMTTVFILAAIIIGFQGLKELLRIKPALAYFSDIRRPGFYFGFLGVFYWLFIIGVRLTSQFDEFGYRLLHPSTFLIAIALLSYVFDQQKATILSRLINIRVLSAVIFPILAISFILPGMPVARGKARLFYESCGQSERRTIAKYNAVPSGSLVIFGDDMARSLRLDLMFENPRPAPYYRAETMADFLERCRAYQPSARIFVNNNAISDAFFTSTYLLYDDSVYRYFREWNKSEREFTEIPAKLPLE